MPSAAAATFPRRVTIFHPRPSHSSHLTGVVMRQSMIGPTVYTYLPVIYSLEI